MNDKLRNSILEAIDIDNGSISSLDISDKGEVILVIEVHPKLAPSLEDMRLKVEREVLALAGVAKVSVILTAEKPPVSDSHKDLRKIDIAAKHIILIASGKGGVGKSTVAANIAATLARDYEVGLLDADIYGPSQPLMMGGGDYKPELNHDNKIIPMDAHGVKVMSIGFMVENSKALVWRGPMMQKALYQLIRDVDWSDDNGKPLDYLIIDMPPGTGDVQLTLAQKLNISGAVIVSTPQDIALIDARRAVDMFHKVNVPVIGILENMSTHICSNCGHEEHVFGHGGAAHEAQSQGVTFLGEIPLSKNIREFSDKGIPIVIAKSDSAQAKAFEDISKNIISALT